MAPVDGIKDGDVVDVVDVVNVDVIDVVCGATMAGNGEGGLSSQRTFWVGGAKDVGGIKEPVPARWVE